MNITIYTKANCPNCVTAKQLLHAKGLAYLEATVEGNPHLLDDLPPDVRQMPQVFINGQRVGGLAGLRVALGQMELL